MNVRIIIKRQQTVLFEQSVTRLNTNVSGLMEELFNLEQTFNKTVPEFRMYIETEP